MNILRFDTAALTSPVDAETVHKEAANLVLAVARKYGKQSWTARTIFRLVVMVVGFGLLWSLLVVAVQSMFGGWGANLYTWLMLGPG